jgi:hypothetical protein
MRFVRTTDWFQTATQLFCHPTACQIGSAAKIYTYTEVSTPLVLVRLTYLSDCTLAKIMAVLTSMSVY